MKDRFYRFSKAIAAAMCMLVMGGLAYSCSDDYDLPDKTPSWLGSSIYDYLKSQGNYTNTIRLIDDLNYAEVLSQTGSKTLFVADDDAFARFYANNTWGVKKYEDLTSSQKKLLLYSSMLDNANLLEMLANVTSGSMNEDGKYLDKNVCLRRYTSSSVTDSIAFYSWDNKGIPYSYNPDDVDYWARFKTQSKGGIYLASDATPTMMVHWINGQMAYQQITDDDFAKIVGQKRSENDVYIYKSKVIQQDITCQNGYVDKLSEVMPAPTNMAEMIRNYKNTTVFGHMLDRFSAPFYNSSLTNSYRQLNPAADSVFEKRYFSIWSQGNQEFTYPPAGTTKVAYYLKFDPGWNTYYPQSTSHSELADMGAMFAPSNEALLTYFQEGGGGSFLMERYATELPVTADNLVRNIDQIPLNVLMAFINNLMQSSFCGTVPSKYLNIYNSANDQMFADISTLDEYKAMIDTCLVATNGVVYVLNKTVSPAEYASVSAPALVNDSLTIFNWAINYDREYVNMPANVQMDYSYMYLLTMSADMSFFIPTDNALKCYYDPVSLVYSQPYALSFYFDPDNKRMVRAQAYRYDQETLELSSTPMTKTIDQSVIFNRFKDMIQSHIVVHDGATDPYGIEDGHTYYLSREGAPVKVSHAALRANGCTVQGGWQIDHNYSCKVQKIYDETRVSNGYGNGMTYIIDHPIEATTNSVYKIMNDNDDENSPYREFFNLCNVDESVLEEAGVVDGYTRREDKNRVLSRYRIFTADKYCLDFNVRFFNAYHYTVFIPSNESVRNAINKGLPTWTSISNYINTQKAYIDAHENDSTFDVDAATAKYKTIAQAMITELINFCKYHFMDQSVFADAVPFASKSYETACVNNATNRYISVNLQSKGNNDLEITDQANNTRNVVGNRNIMARDITFDNQTNRTAANQGFGSSAYTVIHQIDGVLNFKPLTNGRYDSDWATFAGAKRFLAKYRIRK